MLRSARFATFGVALLLVSVPLLGGTPPVSFGKAIVALDDVARVEMPRQDNAALLQATQAREATALSAGPYIFAEAIETGLGLDDGTWERLTDGSWVWRLQVVSPGATSLSALIDPLDLPAGTQLWIYDGQRSVIAGPYGPQDRSRHGRLWTQQIDSDRIVFEIHAADVLRADALRIARVHHGFRAFPTRGGQGSCNIDVICAQGMLWRREIRSVAHYVANGVGGCTGQMINNTANDGRHLFLTAHHCNVRANNDDSVLLFWKDESPTCGQNSGGSPIQQNGTTFLAGHESSDFTLLELNAAPPAGAEIYYSGWDASGATPESTFVIHHPSGGEKSLAFDGQAPVTQTDVLFAGGLVVDEVWQTIWGNGNGTTEGGSSGSCLRDEANGRCIGFLSGGLASCFSPNDPDFFAKLSRAWTGGGTPTTRLSNWLDSTNSGQTSHPGLDPQEGLGCTPDATTACLLDGRFRVELDWRAANGNGGDAFAFDELVSNQSALFHFGNADNLEMLIKMVDACDTSFNSFWVFAAGTTDVEFTLTVTDTDTDTVRTYFNPLGNPANAITDTGAFSTCP